jgi:hypothetical protein
MHDPQIPRPEAAGAGTPFDVYVALVPTDARLPEYLDRQRAEFVALLRGLPDDKALVHHAPYTWSIKQVVGHVTDTERVFAYRAMRIARGDATPLPGFDQDVYVAAAEFDRVPLADLLDEFDHVRRANVLLFRHVPAGAWSYRGTASGHAVTAGTFAYAIGGHTGHHLTIVRRRLGLE